MSWNRFGRSLSTRWRALAVGLCGFALLGTACSDDGGPGEGQAELTVDGLAEVVSVDGSSVQVDDRITLERGDTVTMTDGTGELAVFGGTVAELRVDADGVGTELRIDDLPTLVAGDLLVVAGNPARLRVGEAEVSVLGKARFDADTLVAAGYEGSFDIAGVGAPLTVPALRQTSLSGGGAITPLGYVATDLWDRRFLADAIAFGEQLEMLSRGYTADLQSDQGSTVGFFETVLPALRDQPEFVAGLLGTRTPGEHLIGASIAVEGSIGNFTDRWNAIFGFREQGAAWGLVALDQRVSSAPLLEELTFAIGESPLSDDPRPTTSTTSPPTTRPGDRPPPTQPPGPPPTSPPPTDPPPDPGPGPGGIDLPPVDEILGGLLDSLGLAPSDGTILDDVLDHGSPLLGGGP